ncbi:glucokinase [Luteibacter aegosomatissinici]|uniref:glucokinase n=1 Tax=Luteibacter aegosomatissinici TaxID=2911539 RepID=UPI001FF81122|nr:glucokinase [Luteibacter aegosomatissinici]UPG95030.1 glucokinase [Luteibacter aegosomatissinici]
MLFLAGDIGGTNGHVALMRAADDRPGHIETLAYRVYPCAAFPSLAELIRTFIDSEVRAPVSHCVLACAGQVMGDEVANDNLAWPILPAALRATLGLADVAILNDFEALGYAIDGPLAESGRHLCGPQLRGVGPSLVVGPGTGLGAAIYVPHATGGTVLTTEAGQMDFAPHSVRERDVLAWLAPEGGYVPVELIVSGPGLLTAYEALCALDGVMPALATPKAVTAAAAEESDSRAVEAVALFCAALGSFTGNLAMSYLPTGGIFLAGGFLSSIFDLLKQSAFEERFLHGRSVRAMLAQVPVWVTEHGSHGVQGAARWYMHHREATRTAFAEGAVA